MTLLELIKEEALRKENKIKDILKVFENFFGEDKVELHNLLSIEEIGAMSIEHSTAISQAVLSTSLPVTSTLSSEDLLFIKTNKTLYQAFAYLEVRLIYIYVWYPTVTVSNENNKSVEIEDLFVRIPLDYISGTLSSGFAMARATYSYSQYYAGYRHSHLPPISVSNDIDEFRAPCLGSGPIRNTIATLSTSVKDYISLWELFCIELDKYVHTESTIGGPYIYLEKINKGSSQIKISTLNKLTPSVLKIINQDDTYDASQKNISDFITYFVNEKVLKYSRNEGYYTLGMSFLDYWILVSNSFIKWANLHKIGSFDSLMQHNILLKCSLGNGTIEVGNSRRYTNVSLDQGKHLFNFKGKDIKIRIHEDVEANRNSFILINQKFAQHIIIRLLEILNFNYGRNKSNKSGEDPTSKKPCYV